MVTLQKAVTRAGHVLWVRVLNTKLSTGEKTAGNRDECVTFNGRYYYT